MLSDCLTALAEVMAKWEETGVVMEPRAICDIRTLIVGFAEQARVLEAREASVAPVVALAENVVTFPGRRAETRYVPITTVPDGAA